MRLKYFYFEKNCDDLKSKSPRFLLNKNINFTKNEKKNRKWKMFKRNKYFISPRMRIFLTADCLPYDQLLATVKGAASLT